jgi:hypothetical protein
LRRQAQLSYCWWEASKTIPDKDLRHNVQHALWKLSREDGQVLSSANLRALLASGRLDNDHFYDPKDFAEHEYRVEETKAWFRMNLGVSPRQPSVAEPR